MDLVAFSNNIYTPQKYIHYKHITTVLQSTLLTYTLIFFPNNSNYQSFISTIAIIYQALY